MGWVFNIGDAKAQLSRLIACAEAGEDVILACDGAPVARIVPLERPIGETIALLRRERARRPCVSAAENCTAKAWDRA